MNRFYMFFWLTVMGVLAIVLILLTRNISKDVTRLAQKVASTAQKAENRSDFEVVKYCEYLSAVSINENWDYSKCIANLKDVRDKGVLEVQ